MRNLARDLNLFTVLARMHLHASDYRSFLGALWSFIGPLLTVAVLYFIFAEAIGRSVPLYPLSLLVGVVTLNFFFRTVQTIMQAVLQSRDIVLHSVAPSEVLLLSALAVPVIKFAVEMSVCAVLAACAGVFGLGEFFRLAGGLLLFVGLSGGIGLTLAVLNCLASDVNEIWTVVSPLFFFVTPIFYTLDMLSPMVRSLVYWLNPLTPFILTFQQCVTGGPIPYAHGGNLWVGALQSVFFLILGFSWFKRVEKQILEYL